MPIRNESTLKRKNTPNGIYAEIKCSVSNCRREKRVKPDNCDLSLSTRAFPIHKLVRTSVLYLYTVYIKPFSHYSIN